MKLEISILAQRWMAVSTNKKSKIRSKGSCGGHVTQFLIFGNPNISGMNEAINFKFGIEMDGSEC